MIEPLPLSHFYSTILENEELLNKLSRHHQQDEPDDITALKKELEEDGTVSWSLPIIQTLLLRLGAQVDLITIADEPEDREYEIMVFAGVFWIEGLMEEDEPQFFESVEDATAYLKAAEGIEDD